MGMNIDLVVQEKKSCKFYLSFNALPLKCQITETCSVPVSTGFPLNSGQCLHTHCAACPIQNKQGLSLAFLG